MIRLAFIASLLLIVSGALPAQQQDTPRQDKQPSQQGQQQSGQNQQDSDSPPAPPESTSKKPRAENDKGGKDATPDEPPAISSDAEKAKANATYNPLPAQQDIEVGMFYLHKGDVDAAIDRFLDAIQQRPNLAKPRLLLGKAYEKKHDNESAVKYYKEYLKVLPGAPDAKEVQKKIDKLSKE
jgi:tetratricopeptide (TPR) repeat protein